MGTPKEDSRKAVRYWFEGRDDTTREDVGIMFGYFGAAGGDPQVPLGVVTPKFQLHAKSRAVARNPQWFEQRLGNGNAVLTSSVGNPSVLATVETESFAELICEGLDFGVIPIIATSGKLEAERAIVLCDFGDEWGRYSEQRSE